VRKTFFQILPLVIVVVGGGLFFHGRPGVSEQKKDDSLKNVQVMTDLTREQLEDFMSDVVDYLGVEKCTFCHVRDKSSDENKHKVKARKYMKMVKELNNTVFKDEKPEEKITCFTCHRGEKEVQNKPKE